MMKRCLFFLLPISFAIDAIQLINNLSEFDLLIKHSKKPLFVIASAEWCSVCKKIKNPLQQLSSDQSLINRVEFITIDMDKSAEIIKKLNINRVPTFCYFYQGSEIKREVGTKKPESCDIYFKKQIENLFNLPTSNRKKSTYHQPIYKEYIKTCLISIRSGIDWCISCL